MNVLLINPRFNGRSEIPPLGLLCLAASLLQDDIKTVVLDLDGMTKEEGESILEEIILKDRPAVVGVGALSDSFNSAVEVCDFVKCRNADTMIVLGGMHPSILSDYILKNYENIDAIVRGEGERTLCELVKKVVSGVDFGGVRGVSFRSGGLIVHNEDRPLEKDIDSLPLPAHHLLENSCYRTRNISSSRGCFHKCTFCSIQSQYRRRVRVRSTEKIILEIKNLVNLGARRIMFTDDNFTFSVERIRDLCRKIKEEGFQNKVEFYAEGRMDDICRYPLMAGILSDAGFRALYIGAETGSQRIQEYYGKEITSRDIIEGVSICVEQNITPVVNFILMGPKDSIETIKETTNLARRVFERGAEIAYAETLIPYPGTPIHDELIRDGKYREEGCIFYFESYEGLKLDWFLQLCDVAREITELLHGEEKFIDTKKAYYEMSYLENFLDGTIPPVLKDYFTQHEEKGSIEIEKKLVSLISDTGSAIRVIQ